MRVAPRAGRIGLALEAGVARRFVWAYFERGYDLGGDEDENYRTAYPVADAGLDLTVPVSSRFDVGVGLRGSLPLIESRHAVQFGIRYMANLMIRYHL